MMKVLIFSLSFLSVVILSPRLLNQESLDDIKSKATWDSYELHENPFLNFTKDEIKNMLGTNLTWNKTNMHLFVDFDDHDENITLPEEFDSRKQWPNCVSEVRAQHKCGACWAFSGTSVLSDRFCIASKGAIKVNLSPQELVSCDPVNHGCRGGQLDSAWSFLESTGVTQDECLPYVSGEDKHNIPKCPNGVCSNSTLKYKKYKAAEKQSGPLTCARQIKKELLESGPVQTGFIVYEDFMHYKGGIYEMTHGEEMGGHAVKIVGWGKENNTEFWIAQNSWGSTWGEDGYFRIKMGQCMFDENAFVGFPDVSETMINSLTFLME
jgi:cathepsin B